MAAKKFLFFFDFGMIFLALWQKSYISLLFGWNFNGYISLVPIFFTMTFISSFFNPQKPSTNQGQQSYKFLLAEILFCSVLKPWAPFLSLWVL